MAVLDELPKTCLCCGRKTFKQSTVLWPGLIEEWGLDPGEAAYIDLQQGWHCTACGNNLRTMILARAIARSTGGPEPLTKFVRSRAARGLRLLEINEAGHLTHILKRLRRHRLVKYPETDILHLPFKDESFDVVCHSDTLEHVDDPLGALRECRRVLAKGGILAFTVPIVAGRLTRRRDGLPPSFHGDTGTATFDYRVHTEYGADAWAQVMEAGFDECRIFSIAPPAALALVGVRPER
jgi:SAM-dependent methyltransferase